MSGLTFKPLARELARTLDVEQGASFENTVALLMRLLEALNRGDTALKLDEDETAWLAAQPWVSTDGGTPLVLEDGWLQFQRMWKLEQRIARDLHQRMQRPRPEIQLPETLEEAADTFNLEAEKLDAIRTALNQPVTLLSGGPGTGKTTLLAWLLSAHLMHDPALDFALAAPTGKAARRMAEALNSAVQQVPLDATLRARLTGQTPTTLHRLLGMDLDGQPRWHADRPLPHALVVVDEASMMDVSLMAHLVNALRADAALVLIGDPDQLASVEAGRVLTDLIEGLPQAHLRLTRQRRSRQQITALAHALLDGDTAEAQHLLKAHGMWLSPQHPLLEAMEKGYADYRLALRTPAPTPVEQAERLLSALNAFRVLAPMRSGPRGIEALNGLLLRHWAAEGLLQPAGRGLFTGMPLMLTRNMNALGLSNGDIGVLLRDEDGNDRVWFRQGETLVDLALSALPAQEPALAMTVHKSQGSEFDEVLLVLPDQPHDLISRQLLYTAITRARHGFRLSASEEVLAAGIANTLQRTSRLKARLQALTR